MRRIIWSPAALGDLSDIGEYLEREAGRQVAVRFLGRIRSQVHKLVDFPGAWPKCPDIEPDLRRTIVGEYLIFYTFSDDMVRVWRVLHGRREIKPSMFRR